MTHPPEFTPAPQPKPKLMSGPEAIAYIAKEHDWPITTATLYNWVHRGRAGVKLPMTVRRGRMKFSRRTIDEFVATAQ